MNDRNRVEVFDSASDVVVYDTQKHEIVTSPLLSSEGVRDFSYIFPGWKYALFLFG